MTPQMFTFFLYFVEQGTNYRQPDMSRPFIFHTVAAMKAVGVALTEIDDEYSVEYRSKTFK
jgi:hypothetical protein